MDEATRRLSSLSPRTLFYEKTRFRANVKGSFEPNIVGDSLLSISIGKNYLSFIGTKSPFGLWDVSTDVEELKVNVI